MSKISLSGLQRALTQLVAWAKGLFAEKSGRYGGLDVGSADRLNGVNSVPVMYTKRQYTGESGKAVLTSIKGKSLVWNQLVKNGNFANGTTGWGFGGQSSGHMSVVDNTMTFTFTQVSGRLKTSYTSLVVGHKYACFADAKPTTDRVVDFEITFGWQRISKICPAGQTTKLRGIVTATVSYSASYIQLFTQSAIEEEERITFSNVMLIDLTLMFGAGNEPATAEEFEAMFPMPYYAYNEGVIISNSASGLKIVGFNQWDEEWESGYYNVNGQKQDGANYIRSKGFIPVLPNTQYCFWVLEPNYFTVCEYDADFNFVNRQNDANTLSVHLYTTTANTRYITLTIGSSAKPISTYNHDICVNLSDLSRNGEYEPYRESVLSLNLTTATGKVDGEGASVVVAADGLKSAGSVYDEAIVEDGFITKIIKRVGVVDLGTLSFVPAGSSGKLLVSSDAISGIKTPANDSVALNAIATNRIAINLNGINTVGQMAAHASGRFYLYVDDNTVTAQSGILYYELAEPITYVLDEPIVATYNIEKGGTESVISEDSEGKDAALFLRDIAYPQLADLNMASLFPDFDHLAPVEVIEYDVARNGFCLLYNRANPNGTKASDVTDVVAFRLTVTGADMPEKQVISAMAILSGRQNTYANGFLNANTPDVSAASNYGIYQLRQYAPKVLGSGYGWGMEFNTSTENKRHIKVEVFKKTSAIEFYKVQTASSVNATNYIYAVTNADAMRPLMSLAANIAGSATSAAYINGYLPAYCSAALVTGEAITANDLAYRATDGKTYKVGTTNKPISAELGIFLIGTGYNANTSVGYAYSRKMAGLIAYSAISASRDTFALHDEVFLRCTMSNGEIYSDAYLSKTMSAGYTWISLGIANNDTNFAFNVQGKEFLTLDAQGRLTHVNGKAIDPKVASSQPMGGFAPNVFYALGELDGSVTFALATPSDATIVNHYYWTFDTGSTAPTITWPSGITWYGGSAPEIGASKHYEISVLNGIGTFMEV